MIIGVHHIGVHVTNCAESAAFYKAVADFDEVVRFPAGEGEAAPTLPGAREVELSIVSAPNSYIHLYKPNVLEGREGSRPLINTAGIRHVCIQHRDGMRLADRTRLSGGSLFADPLDLGTGNQYAYSRDREGNIIELEGLPYAPPEQNAWIGHVAIVTREIERTLAFYGALLNASPPAPRAVGPGPQFDKMGGLDDVRLEGAWLPVGNMLLEFWRFLSPPSPMRRDTPNFVDPGYTYICFETDDLARDLEIACANSASLMVEPTRGVWGDSAYVRDPDGNILALHSPGGDEKRSIADLTDPNVCIRVEEGKPQT